MIGLWEAKNGWETLLGTDSSYSRLRWLFYLSGW